MERTLTKIIMSLGQFGLGFLGWFIYANIVFVVIVLIMIGLPSINGLPLVLIGIWVPTIIALIILLYTKNIRAAIGIFVAVTTNTILAGIFSSIFLRISFGYFSDVLLTPLLIPMPTMYVTMFLVVANEAFPPYTVNNLTDLFFIR